jgi:UDP-N-acetyl-D-mannosaminuronate dehydrogenase
METIKIISVCIFIFFLLYFVFIAIRNERTLNIIERNKHFFNKLLKPHNKILRVMSFNDNAPCEVKILICDIGFKSDIDDKAYSLEPRIVLKLLKERKIKELILVQDMKKENYRIKEKARRLKERGLNVDSKRKNSFRIKKNDKISRRYESR